MIEKNTMKKLFRKFVILAALLIAAIIVTDDNYIFADGKKCPPPPSACPLVCPPDKACVWYLASLQYCVYKPICAW